MEIKLSNGSTAELLEERGDTHGPFSENARLSQGLEDLLRTSRNWDILDPVIREALHMICHKLARIGSGDPYFFDHYADIAGYAKLAEDHVARINKQK